ncbi:transcription antitermination factor NusB [Intestinibacter sp.]|uniref:transcription antitermination factor NusB n=1 Tax=Intestinibacter sp. TaxID=1965304 RepID=UPI002A75369C|nr:transcription antitermination factor NusB [Intestinibacter sp.]MDY2736543.1 transcription antitermination factor NusB [Intestinibacter sp.]MDY4575197.1 transcription antitermination factor NusB [Intestinibacter sp.]
MKNRREKRETSREYLMKLMYQTYISNGDITDLNNEIDIFLENNEEYIVNRYEELVLNYSDKEIEFEGISVNDCVDRVYLDTMCEVLRDKIDDINELIENNAKNWSINRFSKIDLSILQIAIAEMLSDLNIPDKVSINEAIDLAKMYCEEKTPKFINGILGSVVNEIKKR